MHLFAPPRLPVNFISFTCASQLQLQLQRITSDWCYCNSLIIAMHPNYNCNYSTSAIATVPSSIECNATHFQLHLQCSTIEHNTLHVFHSQLHLQCRGSQLTPGITLFPLFANHIVCFCVLSNQFEATSTSLLLNVHVLNSQALSQGSFL